MAFSNPFDDPQGAFYILRNAQGQFSLWPQQCALPAGWGGVCLPQYGNHRQAGTLGASRSHRRPASSGWKPTGVL